MRVSSCLDGSIEIKTEDGETVAEICEGAPEGIENVLAAAPDMLEALRGTLNSRGCLPGCGRNRSSDTAHGFKCSRVRAAIAKAEGRS